MAPVLLLFATVTTFTITSCNRYRSTFYPDIPNYVSNRTAPQPTHAATTIKPAGTAADSNNTRASDFATNKTGMPTALANTATFEVPHSGTNSSFAGDPSEARHNGTWDSYARFNDSSGGDYDAGEGAPNHGENQGDSLGASASGWNRNGSGDGRKYKRTKKKSDLNGDGIFKSDANFPNATGNAAYGNSSTDNLFAGENFAPELPAELRRTVGGNVVIVSENGSGIPPINESSATEISSDVMSAPPADAALFNSGPVAKLSGNFSSTARGLKNSSREVLNEMKGMRFENKSFSSKSSGNTENISAYVNQTEAPLTNWNGRADAGNATSVNRSHLADLRDAREVNCSRINTIDGQPRGKIKNSATIIKQTNYPYLHKCKSEAFFLSNPKDKYESTKGDVPVDGVALKGCTNTEDGSCNGSTVKHIDDRTHFGGDFLEIPYLKRIGPSNSTDNVSFSSVREEVSLTTWQSSGQQESRPTSMGLIQKLKPIVIKRDHLSHTISDQSITGMPSNGGEVSAKTSLGHFQGVRISSGTSRMDPYLLQDVLSESTLIDHVSSEAPDDKETTTYMQGTLADTETETTAHSPSIINHSAVTHPTTITPIKGQEENSKTMGLMESESVLQPTREPEVSLEKPLPENFNANKLGDGEDFTRGAAFGTNSPTAKTDNVFSSSNLFKMFGHVTCVDCPKDGNTSRLNDTDGKLQSESKTRSKVYGTVTLNKSTAAKSGSSAGVVVGNVRDILFPTSTVSYVSSDSGSSDKSSVSGDVSDYLVDEYDGQLITGGDVALNATADYGNETYENGSAAMKVIQKFPWPVKEEAVVEGDLVLGGLMMIHEREDMITCGPVMPQGGIQALEAMLYTLDRLNKSPHPLVPNITLGAHILDDCDKDTYGLEMAVDFIKGKTKLY